MQQQQPARKPLFGGGPVGGFRLVMVPTADGAGPSPAATSAVPLFGGAAVGSGPSAVATAGTAHPPAVSVEEIFLKPDEMLEFAESETSELVAKPAKDKTRFDFYENIYKQDPDQCYVYPVEILRKRVAARMQRPLTNDEWSRFCKNLNYGLDEAVNETVKFAYIDVFGEHPFESPPCSSELPVRPTSLLVSGDSSVRAEDLGPAAAAVSLATPGASESRATTSEVVETESEAEQEEEVSEDGWMTCYDIRPGTLVYEHAQSDIPYARGTS